MGLVKVAKEYKERGSKFICMRFLQLIAKNELVDFSVKIIDSTSITRHTYTAIEYGSYSEFLLKY